jgi:pyruvate dehydrogenase E2 component (dihydrolipoamide acetyltransferase)
MPPLGEGVSEGVVLNICAESGARVAATDTVLEVETDKVVVDVPAGFEGIILELLVQPGDTVREGVPFLIVDRQAGDNGVPVPAATAVSPPESPSDSYRYPATETPFVAPSARIDDEPTVVGKRAAGTGGTAGARSIAGPAARLLARQLGVSLEDVAPSGPRGRITRKDVRDHVRCSLQGGRYSEESLQLPDLSVFGPVRFEAQSGIGQATSRNMARSWREIPHAWLQEQIAIETLEESRRRFRSRVPGLTVTAILCKCLAVALSDHRRLLGTIDPQGSKVVFRNYIHLGVAVDTPRGLLVPVIRDIDCLSLGEIAAELARLSEQARSGRLSPQDLQGGSFTLSNLGGIGTTGMFPLVNWPQAGILGVSSSYQRPALHNGALVEERVMPVTLGFDHRLINGADGARFLVTLKSLLEDPLSLVFR